MSSHCISSGLLGTSKVLDRVLVVCDGPVNFYVVQAPTGLVCVDAGWRSRCVQKGVQSLGLSIEGVAAVFLTHLHWDHARGHCFFPNARVFVGEREKTGFFVRREEAGRSWTRVSDGQELSVAGLKVRVVSTPGHTRGSVSYVVDDRFLFTGDALSLRDGLAVPFPSLFNHDAAAMRDSLRKLSAVGSMEGLFTGHSGFTSDVDRAFHAWRAVPHGGGGSGA